MTGASFLTDGSEVPDNREDCLCLDVNLDDLISFTSESTIEASNDLLLEKIKSIESSEKTEKILRKTNRLTHKSEANK